MRRGFTLVEMLIVIVIIGILASALIPRLQSAQSKARDIARMANIKDMSTALELYSVDNGSYPTGAGYAMNTSGYITSTGTEWKTNLQEQLSPYIKSLPTDPQSSRAYVYGYVYNTPSNYYRLYADYEFKASDKGLVGYRDMDTLVGTKLRDMSGNGNDGTINGAVFAGGVIGRAMSFDGNFNYLALNRGVYLDYGSLSAWIKSYEIDGFRFYYYDRETRRGNSTIQTFSSGMWYHIVFTYNGSIYKYYVNGIQQEIQNKTSNSYDVNDTTVGPIFSNVRPGSNRHQEFGIIKTTLSNVMTSNTFFQTSGWRSDIGSIQTNGNKRFFSGDIDQVRIYNRALSASEIKDLYNSQK